MRRNHKLSANYYGPYTVTKKIGNVAYQIDLPVGSKVHNVFHVSQLKKRIGKEKKVHTDLPGVNDEGELKMEPQAVLDRKLVKRNNGPATMVLVQWKNGEETEATWEYWEDMIRKFPSFNP